MCKLIWQSTSLEGMKTFNESYANHNEVTVIVVICLDIWGMAGDALFVISYSYYINVCIYLYSLVDYKCLWVTSAGSFISD